MSRPVRLTAADGERLFDLAIALDTRDMEELRSKFAVDLAWSLAAIGLVLFGGAVIQAAYGLAPLSLLRRRLSDVHSGAAVRVEGAFPEEVAPLVDDLNTLMDRQANLVQRARSRAGDLAHGLKTPLTILQGLERRRREVGDIESADLLRQQIEAMRAHVERELSRARTHGKAAAGGTLTDAAATIDRLVALISRAPRGDTLTWEIEFPDGLRLRMDPDDFGEVVGNLLDNARKSASTRVRIARETVGDESFLVVDDDGPGIPHDRIPHLVGRGVSEDVTAEGSGLGLSIVTDILASHHMALHLEVAPLGGCRARFGPIGEVTFVP
jgi:signal transduction histidine kinase